MRLTVWHPGVVLTVLSLLLSGGGVFALEERYEDLTASVEVATDFGVDVTQAFLTFPNVSPGRTSLLGENRFFNEVKCRSNTGRSWSLKAHLVTLKHTGTNRVLPASTLRWKVVGSTGSGSSAGRTEFQPFSEQPETIYESGGADSRGQSVALQFQYSLTPPPSSLAGTYVGQIVFTMAEAL